MPDDLTTLATQLRDFLLPEIERTVREPLERRIDSLRDEMNSHLDAIWKELRDLKQEYYAITAGLKRLEQKIDTMASRAELEELKERVAALEQRLASLEARSAGTRV